MFLLSDRKTNRKTRLRIFLYNQIVADTRKRIVISIKIKLCFFLVDPNYTQRIYALYTKKKNPTTTQNVNIKMNNSRI